MSGEQKIMPKTIRISLGGYCGFNCCYCFLADEGKGVVTLSPKLLEEMLSEAASLGFSSFSFIGREPLSELDMLIELITHGKKIGLEYQAFYTNGLKLGTRQQAQKIFCRFKERGIEMPLALSLDEEKLRQLSAFSENPWEHVLGIIKAFVQVYPGHQLELGRVTVNDNVVTELLLKLGDLASEVHSYHIETNERKSLCYFPTQISVLEEFFGHFTSLKHAYLIYLHDGSQLLIHNREFSKTGRGGQFLADYPEKKLQDQNVLIKDYRDTVYTNRIGSIFTSYIKLAKNEAPLGQYQGKGDLKAALNG